MSANKLAMDFLDVLQAHKGIIYQVARAYCVNGEDRKDLIQDITLQLWRSFGLYSEEYKYSTWIYRIALNVAISRYRKEQPRQGRTETLSTDILVMSEEPQVDGQDENVQLLHGFIADLKPLDKALMLLYLDGRKYQEIAEVMGLSHTNVATKIARVKILLRQKFSSNLKQ